jgi:hypothetical protein
MRSQIRPQGGSLARCDTAKDIADPCEVSYPDLFRQPHVLSIRSRPRAAVFGTQLVLFIDGFELEKHLVPEKVGVRKTASDHMRTLTSIRSCR